MGAAESMFLRGFYVGKKNEPEKVQKSNQNQSTWRGGHVHRRFQLWRLMLVKKKKKATQKSELGR